MPAMTTAVGGKIGLKIGRKVGMKIGKKIGKKGARIAVKHGKRQVKRMMKRMVKRKLRQIKQKQIERGKQALRNAAVEGKNRDFMLLPKLCLFLVGVGVVGANIIALVRRLMYYW